MSACGGAPLVLPGLFLVTIGHRIRTWKSARLQGQDPNPQFKPNTHSWDLATSSLDEALLRSFWACYHSLPPVVLLRGARCTGAMRHRHRGERAPSPMAPVAKRKGTSLKVPASRGGSLKSIGVVHTSKRKGRKRGGTPLRAVSAANAAIPPPPQAVPRPVLSAPNAARIIDVAPARCLDALRARASAAVAAASAWDGAEPRRSSSSGAETRGSDDTTGSLMNKFLMGAGLGGTAVYDLQALEAELANAAQSMPESSGMGGDADETRGAYEERAKRLQGMLPAAVSAAAREAHRRQVMEQTALIAAEQAEAQARRGPRPKPTPLSDVDAVLGWLERRQLRMREASPGGKTIADEPDGGPRRPPSSPLSGGVHRWQRAHGRLGDTLALASSTGGSPTGASCSDGMSTPPPRDAFERQRLLVREADACSAGTCSGESEDELSDSEGSDSSDDEREGEAGLGGTLRRHGAGGLSAHRHLAVLERQKSEAKQRVVECERELRARLGRKPTEPERHADEPFQEALGLFKHASQRLFVAKSVANWND